MSQKAYGACQCGAVTFKISGNFDSFFLCHCSRCQKDTGSAHAANLFSLNATIAWLSGQECIKTYRIPNTRHEKSFCINCGSALPNAQQDDSLLVVPAGSLDSPVELRPIAHICCSSRAEWDLNLENIPKIDNLPGTAE